LEESMELISARFGFFNDNAKCRGNHDFLSTSNSS